MANLFVMIEAADVTTVLRTLADPTRRAVFERVVGPSEISVADLTLGSGVTQGAISQHLKALKQAGLVADRPEGRKVFYRARPEGLEPLVDVDGPLRRLLARALCRSQNPVEGNRPMNDTAAPVRHPADRGGRGASRTRPKRSGRR